MNIKQLIDQLDQEFVKKHNDYIKLHDELNKHRGKPINDTNLPEVNRIIGEIQDKFHEMHPGLHMIAYRYQWAVNIVNNHSDFIETIKKIGATATEKEK